MFSWEWVTVLSLSLWFLCKLNQKGEKREYIGRKMTSKLSQNVQQFNHYLSFPPLFLKKKKYVCLNLYGY